jgi:hypothetical protein
MTGSLVIDCVYILSCGGGLCVPSVAMSLFEPGIFGVLDSYMHIVMQRLE